MNLDNPIGWPGFQLCKPLTEKPTGNDRFLWEQKLDGVRAMVSSSSLALRNIVVTEHSLTLRSGERVPLGCLLDGEILLPGKSFTDITGKITKGRWNELTFIPFDLIVWEGKTIVGLPLRERKARLDELDPGPAILAKPWMPLPDIPLDMEGVVGKSLNSPYLASKRAGWVKWKLTGIITAVVTGFVEGTGSWAGTTGGVRFGLEHEGKLIELGKAGGLTTIQRYEFTKNPDKYIGKPCKIRHFGFVKGMLRNPIFEEMG